jgi:hypothetical protein
MQPKEISAVDLAFPTSVKDLMPDYGVIPVEFRRGTTKWNRLFSTWFYHGISGAKFAPKAGIDTEKALQHISAVMRSWEPKHEHKEAAAAYLMSLWFEDVVLPEPKDK